MRATFSLSKLIDPSVFISMAFAALVSVVILGFKIYNYEPCPEIEISFKPGILHVGEIIQFKALSTKGKPQKIDWKFGTSSNSAKSGFVVNHTFDQPGRYEVELRADNTCGVYTTIYVQDAPVFIDETLVAIFLAPKIAEVGIPVTFEDLTENAEKWEWWFGENNVIDATSREATYTFETAGRKSIKLIVNGNRVGEQLIEVLSAKSIQKRQPAPKRHPIIELPERSMDSNLQKPQEEASSAPEMFPEITVNEMEEFLKSIVEGKKTIDDLHQFLCVNGSMQVTYNGTLVSLSELDAALGEIKKEKRIRELEVIFYKNPTTNCIFSMSINIKKKGFILF